MNLISINTDAVFSGYTLSYKQMPMNPLGNKEVERAITKNTEEAENKTFAAVTSKITESQKANISNNSTQGNAPWRELMEQLQLHFTGIEEEDYNNIMEELRFQLENAQSQYDYNYYAWLLNTTNNLFTGVDEDSEEYDEFNAYVNNLRTMQTINMSLL